MLADDQLENPTPRAREFQVVVLAGHGANLQPLTNNVSGNTAAKALLPVGNRPMISYVLHWVEDCGISDVLVVCPSVLKPEISHHLHRAEYSNMRLELKSVDEDDVSISGTAEVLRAIEDMIKLDVVVLPCDFMPPPSLSLTELLNAFREDASEPVAAVLLYERQIPADGKDKGPKLVVGTDETTNTLLYVDGDNDDDEDLEIHMGLTKEFPNARFTTRYLDSHVYVLRRSILEILREHPGLLSFREEVLPWVCKLGYRKSKRDRWGTTLKPQDPAFKLAMLHATTHVQRDPLTGMITTSPTSSEIPQPYDEEFTQEVPKSTGSKPLRTAYVVHRAKDGFSGRGNTISGYMELNRQVLSQLASKANSTRNTKSSAVGDSVIPTSATVGERASIKRSVIGEHCRIGKNVKIQGSVVMDHVEIADGAKLDNCIVSRLCQIGERAVLKDCEIETAFRVPADANMKGEKLET
ncbi:putative translation initiation factor eIF-2B subunit gamma OS=Schizosaccharomyces pombe (strain 972 / ATCC 24843) GN=tif223 PE=1 SV=2 [Rhizoctonia solani AG-1 IB]|uniref:Translation initiation factor eIF2B subunit gamma n=2 Tax=Thanatephorus cucumeris (strain AG1-IB / isolate 7/3/14) TaxID=1108050 RepID=A0A0B7G109_THACB|nr:putative translation initiation factor eIF-2B subunit gamma OS=Schizosaccharomyces pombe (strain 972 / ATCC 24843) GN=tif223 PE=1 SV=2 [Rhizoctonia solani AG-1 IB]